MKHLVRAVMSLLSISVLLTSCGDPRINDRDVDLAALRATAVVSDREELELWQQETLGDESRPSLERLTLAMKTERVDEFDAILDKWAKETTNFSSSRRELSQAFQYACMSSSAYYFERLLAYGPDLDLIWSPGGGKWAGYSNLMLAARTGDAHKVRRLLTKGANLKYQVIAQSEEYEADPWSNADAFIVALANHHFDIAEILFQFGSDPNVKFDTYTATPLQNANHIGDEAIADFLRKHGGRNYE